MGVKPPMLLIYNWVPFWASTPVVTDQFESWPVILDISISASQIRKNRIFSSLYHRRLAVIFLTMATRVCNDESKTQGRLLTVLRESAHTKPWWGYIFNWPKSQLCTKENYTHKSDLLDTVLQVVYCFLI